jgi:Domain of unknown function (DUF4157)
MHGYQPASDRARSTDPRRSAAPAEVIGREVGPATAMSLQPTLGNSAVASLVGGAGVAAVLGSPGRPLAEPLRQEMEARLGADFGDVRIHSDAAAHDSADALHAGAYTVGAHIAFQHGRYDPASASGRRVLAHELAHVVQQRHGPVSGVPAGDGLAVSDPGDQFEREAETVAAAVAAGPDVRPGTDGR